MLPTNIEHVAAEIRQVERLPHSQAVGAQGELGPYQLTRAVWTQHTGLPFSLAADPVYAKSVALQHLHWLAMGLTRNRLPADTYHLALAWNAGLTATINGRTNHRQRDFARRVSNLVASRISSTDP